MPRPNAEPDRESLVGRTDPSRRDESVAGPAAADVAGEEVGELVDTAAFDPLEDDVADETGAEDEPIPAQDDAPVATPAADLEHRTAMIDSEDPAQHFVSRLRAAAVEFAAAAGAESAVVREAVPPARHRRSRCRLVLRYPGGDEADLTFLGSVGRPGTPAWLGFDVQIQQWLGNGQHREAAWLVEDPEAPDGVAVDVPAWLAAG